MMWIIINLVDFHSKLLYFYALNWCVFVILYYVTMCLADEITIVLSILTLLILLNGFKLSRPSSHCNSMKEYKFFYVWSEQCITLPSPFSLLVMVLPNYTRRPSYKRIKGWLIGATAKLMMFNFTSKCWHGFQFNNTIFITFL